VSSSFLSFPSSARMMPSSCSHETKSGVRGITRERMQEERYLGLLAGCAHSEDSGFLALWKPVVVGAVEDVVPCDRRKPQLPFGGLLLGRCWFDGRHGRVITAWLSDIHLDRNV
jgi:hypothetical protein